MSAAVPDGDSPLTRKRLDLRIVDHGSQRSIEEQRQYRGVKPHRNNSGGALYEICAVTSPVRLAHQIDSLRGEEPLVAKPLHSSHIRCSRRKSPHRKRTGGGVSRDLCGCQARQIPPPRADIHKQVLPLPPRDDRRRQGEDRVARQCRVKSPFGQLLSRPCIPDSSDSAS